MKASTLLLSILLIASKSLMAALYNKQTRPDIDYLVSQLELDSHKSDRLKAIMAEHRQQMESMRDQKQQAREERHEMRTQHREELLTVLSYEQLYKFEEYMHQFRPKRSKNSDQPQ
jgi:uncharacterized protein (DUF3084 family)